VLPFCAVEAEVSTVVAVPAATATAAAVAVEKSF